MIFSRAQINILLAIIRKHQTIFIANQVGLDHISPIDKLLLKSYGINIKTLGKKMSNIEQAFYFGILSQVLGDDKTKNLSFKGFLKLFKEVKYIPLSEGQKAALDFIKTRAYNDIGGLGRKIENNFTNMLLSGGKKEELRVKKLIKKKTLTAIRESRSVGWLASELRNNAKDWARDFDRIADYLMHEAYDTGRAQEILNKYGEEAIVYKDVYKGACKYCIDLYLTAGIGSEPKLFKLIELIANGTNIGVKAKDYKPVIGPVHPFCRCTLSYVPNDTKWNSKTKSFSTVVRNKHGVKRKSKIKITLNGEEI